MFIKHKHIDIYKEGLHSRKGQYSERTSKKRGYSVSPSLSPSQSSSDVHTNDVQSDSDSPIIKNTQETNKKKGEIVVGIVENMVDNIINEYQTMSKLDLSTGQNVC